MGLFFLGDWFVWNGLIGRRAALSCVGDIMAVFGANVRICLFHGSWTDEFMVLLGHVVYG